MAERITHGLIPTHCLCVTTNGTGDMRSYKIGPSIRKAGLVLMAVFGTSTTAPGALGWPDCVRDSLRGLPLDAAR